MLGWDSVTAFVIESAGPIRYTGSAHTARRHAIFLACQARPRPPSPRPMTAPG